MTAEAARIGFPLMVKAAAGGGGRGMRLLTAGHELPNALARARSEAARAFGSDELILERAVVGARHVEFQIFADQHGNIIHLGERDCSIQRRHQKVIEEAPSPFVSTELRARMGEAAVVAARAIGYVGAGTVEFLLDPAGQFYFLEMNTRLQVEHAVTEAISGLDLVAWQLNVAAGAKLPLEQPQVILSGHAIEARLYAEDPQNGFLPQSGAIIDWRPARGDGVRIDHGLLPGGTVSAFYDPMLAKVIAQGATREEARRRLIRALEDTVVFGVKTNRSLLLDMLRHSAFAAGEATTAFVDQYFPTGGDGSRTEDARMRALALAAVLFFEARARSASAYPSLAWRWSSTGVAVWPLQLQLDDSRHAATVTTVGTNDFSVAVGSGSVEVAVVHVGDGVARFAISGVQQGARFALRDDVLHLDFDGEVFEVRDVTHSSAVSSRGAGSSRLIAPMNGVIVSVLANPDDPVAKGQCVVVLEAMKMQHEIVAERDGIIDTILVNPGDQVATRALLAELKPDEPAAARHEEAAT
jgi:geranyl-CoA carboxylase alpha subunit